ncbi:MAG: prolipoprotein diacylglyceryl transferase [Lachnospiraceae bacterium]|nr:prolipoprotein diacylglyceryl transferase [Lachnospiraceae bacterium]
MYPYIPIYKEIKIPCYTLCFFVGFVIAVCMAMKSINKLPPKDSQISFPNKYDVLFAAVYALIGLAAGAKIFFVLSRLPKVIAHPAAYKAMWNLSKAAALNYLFGGLVFYGGLLGAAVGTYIYCRQYKVLLEPIVKVTAPLIPFVHGFGRIGCFLGGCCYGIEYHGIFSVKYPFNEMVPKLNEVPRFPVQLLEAGLNFICTFVLLSLGKKMDSRRLLGSYLFYYSVTRFLLEYLRGDAERGVYSLFSTSQVISIILFPIAVFLIVGQRFGLKNAKKEKADYGP